MNDNLKSVILSELAKWKREQHKRLSPQEALNKWQGVPDVYIHFTNGIEVETSPGRLEVTNDEGRIKSPKKATYFPLSVNVKSSHSTPVGIYAYPSSMIKDIETNKIPFMADAAKIIIFRAREPSKTLYLDIGSYTEEKFDQDIEKLKFIFHTDDEILTKILTDEVDELHKQSLGGQIWGLTYFLSNKNSKAWNLLFQKLGYQGVSDPGYSIIHSNEPKQAVFFSESFIETLDVVDNPKIEKEEKNYTGLITMLSKNPNAFESVVSKFPDRSTFLQDLGGAFDDVVNDKGWTDRMVALFEKLYSLGQEDITDIFGERERTLDLCWEYLDAVKEHIAPEKAEELGEKVPLSQSRIQSMLFQEFSYYMPVGVTDKMIAFKKGMVNQLQPSIKRALEMMIQKAYTKKTNKNQIERMIVIGKKMGLDLNSFLEKLTLEETYFNQHDKHLAS